MLTMEGGADERVRVELQHEMVRYARVLHSLKAQVADVMPPGLDPAAGQLLAWLIKQGPSRQAELAGETLLDPSTVSRRVSRLVQGGLVERRIDPADGRAVQLVPTAAGEAFFYTLRERRGQIMRQVLAGWSDTDVAHLADLLRTFNDDFDIYRSRLNAPMNTPPGPRADPDVTGSGPHDPAPRRP